MAEVVAVYDMFVYDDGTVKITHRRDVNTTGKCSKSMKQIIAVLDYVTEDVKKNGVDGIRSCISNSVIRVATEMELEVSSVHSKCTRKLGLEMKEFKDLVERYFKKQPYYCINSRGEMEEITLVETLKKACVAKTRGADESAVDALIKRMDEVISIRQGGDVVE